MVTLVTFEKDAKTKTILKVMARDGAVIVKDVLPDKDREIFLDETMPYIDRTAPGRDNFTGRQTQRTGGLVARSAKCRDLVMHKLIMKCANGFLGPHTERILLHVTQTIRLGPGQGKQAFHRDREAWGRQLPMAIEPQFNTIWALSDFTADNGATCIVPGSQNWDWSRRARKDEVCQAEMSTGSVLFYSGSVIHSGGENRTTEHRLGLNITYCLGWLRQEENQYLSCPPHIARDFDPQVQELLGYTMGNYALGYYTDPESEEAGSDLQPPERALGRKPRRGFLSP